MVKRKIWITRNSAFSIQCGGLERLFIHFSKPTYFYEKLTTKDRDIPFGYIEESEGLFKKIGWIETQPKMFMPSISVGNFIGYDNEMSEFIWNKLKEHFLNEEFDKWHILEEENKCKIENFLLEMTISIDFS
jgi:hypothetical protein